MALTNHLPRSKRDLIDVRYYNEAAQTEFDTEEDVLRHSAKQTIAGAPAVNKYFAPDWYVWQNPDARAYKTVLDHFWDVGDRRIIDPCPFVDLTLFCRTAGYTTSKDALWGLMNGQWSVEHGVHSSFVSLAECQRKFLSQIQTYKLIDRREQKTRGRKKLVWVQIGPNSEFVRWFDRNAPRNWDVLTNWYDFSAMDLSFSDIALSQRGTKFTAVARTLEKYPDLFSDYDQLLFLDDDLIFQFSDIEALFSSAHKHGLDIFQAGLTEDSHCIWPELKKTSSSGWRHLNAVEIMMPGFSRRGFDTVKHIFEQSVSGFGLDLAMGKIAQEAALGVGIIDHVKARHLKPINQSDGAYYEYLRKAGINSKLELWRLMQEFDTDREIKAV